MAEYIATESGLEPRYKVRNPLGLDWGCVVMYKNQHVCFVQNFREETHRRSIVISNNKWILDKPLIEKQRYRYRLTVHYGKDLREFLTNTNEKTNN